MLYFILSSLIIVSIGVVVFVMRRSWGRIEESHIKEAEEKRRQADIKQRLLESKLKKNLMSWVGGVGHGVVKRYKNLANLKDVADRVKDELRVRVKKSNKSMPEIEKVVKKESVKKTDPSLILVEARTLFKKRKYDEAEEKFIEVLKDEPKNVEAYMSLGKIYTFRKDFETAEEAFRYIVKIDKKNYEGHRELVNLYKAQKKWSEVRELCQELLGGGHEESWVYVSLGMAEQKTGYPEKAEDHYKRAVEIEPQNEALLDYLIEVAIINKNKSLVEKCFNTLRGISGDDVKLQDYRNKLDII